MQRRGEIISTEGLESVSAAKADVREQLLLFYMHKQNKSDDHDAPAANYVLIFCVMLTLPVNALCLYVHESKS